MNQIRKKHSDRINFQNVTKSNEQQKLFHIFYLKFELRVDTFCIVAIQFGNRRATIFHSASISSSFQTKNKTNTRIIHITNAYTYNLILSNITTKDQMLILFKSINWQCPNMSVTRNCEVCEQPRAHIFFVVAHMLENSRMFAIPSHRHVWTLIRYQTINYIILLLMHSILFCFRYTIHTCIQAILYAQHYHYYKYYHYIVHAFNTRIFYHLKRNSIKL